MNRPPVGVGTPISDERHPQVVAQHERLLRQRDRIRELGLEGNVVDLELFGYTVLDDVKPPSFFEELRAEILRCGEEDRELGRTLPLSAGGDSYLVGQLLARGRIFEEALLVDDVLCLVDHLVGEHCQISSVNGHVRTQGDVPQGMHNDAPFVPEPVPHWVHTCNAMWCLDDFTVEGGGTMVVPGSHLRGGTPLPGSTTRNMAVSVDAPAGSVIVFNGNLWHGAGARTLPGERVGMTMYFSRMYARTQEPMDEIISDEIVARNPPRFARLVGRENPYPSRGRYGLDNALQGRAAFHTWDPRG